ncbi:Scr1 family TA system antitoxin-like transcriptional regulator [Amycolatopsis kentuckyensis]|uniref:Scr1 family TA system antitoxin-like transcriptional regulator n=1 Tax=Amycolatopsis kentuckyensis TaxID=218823 RepID=UPI0035612AFF
MCRYRWFSAAAGVHPGLRGAFSVLRFPEDTITDLGYVDHAGGHLQLVKQTQVAELIRQFRKLSRMALGESESRDLVFALANEMSA